jgi:CubicO group peptidase (beta-lactamase class C family)
VSATGGLDTIDVLLSRACEEHRVPGVVAVIADRDQIRFLRAYGSANVELGLAMHEDAVFRVASLTKAVVAIAVLSLVERGELDLDAPVGSIIPAFDEVMVLEGFDGEVPRLRPPRRRATVRNLMTHTSGLTYDAFEPNLMRYGTVTGVPMPSTGLKACFRSPMVFDPGTRFAYGMSTDWTGQVLETVTGQTLDGYLHEHVLDPLGLTDIAFRLDDDQQPRLAAVHLRAGDDEFKVIDFEWPPDPEFDSAGHGLYATARDYAEIQRLLLRSGELDGVRLLQPETVDMMMSDHLGDVRMQRLPTTRPDFTYDLDPGPNVSWGLDIMVTTKGAPGLRPAGSAGWCGTFNNYYWIDRAAGVAAALHMSYLPLFDPAATGLFERFECAVYESLNSTPSTTPVPLSRPR